MFGQSQIHTSGQGSDDTVGNSLGVRQELIEDIESLPGWCKGVRWKKTTTHQKIVGVSRKACRELGRYRAKVLDNAMKARWAFARTSPKVSRRSLGTRQEIARRRLSDLPLEIPEVARLRE
ncbi:hypothetical protein BHE74_00039462 [Ensete ventricosum]|nr:hypothetical protein BHE74_00039462 [Ensete ventricosum]